MRWLIRSVLAMVVVTLLAVALVLMIPSERIAALAADRFAQITGRTLVISGAVRPSFYPTLGVQTGPVSVSNADWSDEGDMLRAEGLSIALDMAALIGGEVKITAIRAQAPQLVLERGGDGRENWVFGGANGGTASSGMAGDGTPFTLDLAEVSDGAITYIDHASDRRVSLSGVTGTVRIPNFNGTADITFDAILNGQTLNAAIKIAQFAYFLDGAPGDVDLNLNVGAAEVKFAGRAGWNPLVASGALTADLADLDAIARAVGMAPPALPQGLGAGRVQVQGEVTLTDQMSVHLRAGVVTLDDNRLTLDADLTTAGDRPKLSAQARAGALSLAAAMGGQGGEIGGGARGGTSADGWPTEPLDVSGLSALDASVAISADSVDLGVAQLGQAQVMMTIDRGRAVFDLRQISAYQGSITGQFVVNGRGGLSVGGDLVLSGLAMQPLLTDLGGYDRLIGTGDLALKFLGVGGSIDAIMRSLSGSGSLALGRGEVRGLDLAGMLRTLDAGYVGEGQKTIFDAITASYGIENGVLTNSDLAFAAPYVTASGAGSVDLGARSLDYRLRPVALAAVDGTGGILVPLMITGPWADPRFRLDLESLARDQFEADARAAAARAEDQARAELTRRAEEELGIVQQPDETFEDAARRRAEEALDAEAGRLLERLLGRN